MHPNNVKRQKHLENEIQTSTNINVILTSQGNATITFRITYLTSDIYIYIISYNTSPRLIECAFIFFSIWVTIGCGFLGRVHVVLGILGHGMKTWLGFSVFCQRTLV